MKGFAKWVCKLEGKELPVKVKLDKIAPHLKFPGEIYSEMSFRDLITDILENGVGSYLDDADGLDDAFYWYSHELECNWECLNGLDEPITQQQYEAAQFWLDNWEHRNDPAYRWSENDEEAYGDVEDIAPWHTSEPPTVSIRSTTRVESIFIDDGSW